MLSLYHPPRGLRGREGHHQRMDVDEQDENELAYVERASNSLSGKELSEEAIALAKYKKILHAEAKVRDRKFQNQAALRSLNTEINRLSRKIGRLRQNALRQQNMSKSMSADPNPEAEASPEEDEVDDGETVEQIEEQLDLLLVERDSEVTLCEADIDAFTVDMPVLTAREKVIVRGFVALEKQRKSSVMNAFTRRSSRGVELTKIKRFTNQQFIDFFQQRNGLRFDELSHSDLVDLSDHFRQCDYNQSGLFESDDFVRLVQRLMCDVGITAGEIERVGIYCGVSTIDGFALNMGQFYHLMFALLPALTEAENRIRCVAHESLEGLRMRQEMSKKHETEKYEIEKIRPSKLLSPKTELTPDQILEVEARMKLLAQKRLLWARTAVILTIQELDRLRSLKISEKVSSSELTPNGRRSPPSAPAPHAKKPAKEKAEKALDAGKSAEAAVETPPPRRTAEQKFTKHLPTPNRPNVSARTCREIEKFRISVKTALERAPFPDPTSMESAQPTEAINDSLLLQFRTLFDVLSEHQPVISPANVLSLMEIFTPCGCDSSEAEHFLREECEGLKELSFEQFLRFGSRLRSRIFAAAAFQALPSDRARVQAVVDRSDNLRRSKPLRRYERVFMRLHLAQQKEHREKKIQARSNSPSARTGRTAEEKDGGSARKPNPPTARPATAAIPGGSDAVVLVGQKEAATAGPPAVPTPADRARHAASARRITSERRVPLPPSRDAKADCLRYDLHANRLAQDYSLVTGLRSLYDL
jgi:hypothetical protein